MNLDWTALRRRIHDVLEPGRSASLLSRSIAVALVTLIASNVLAVVLESVDEIGEAYSEAFARFEVVSVAFFSLEYILRLWSCVERLDVAHHRSGWRARVRYAVSPMALIDLFSILPFFLAMIFAIDLRMLRVVRLLRILKITRFSGGLNILTQVLRAEAQAFGAAFSVLLSLIVLASSGIYLAEHAAQPEAFASIPAAMWWSVSTLTTVGYGDLVPITPLGRLFSGFMMVIGIGFVAIPAGLLASGFSEEMARRRRTYTRVLEESLADGVLNHEEREQLEALRAELGMDRTDVRELNRDAIDSALHRSELETCPHCGKDLPEEP